MTGNFYIDDHDAYSSYGVFITEGGYEDLAAFPALKPIESNDWAEEDGIEPDLSSPVLDTRELSVKFAFLGSRNLLARFIECLSDGAYHDFNFSDLDKTYRLRLVSQSNMKQSRTLSSFSLHFADDFPLSSYSYITPQSGIAPKQGYKLDGRDFSEYGVSILKGSETEIQKIPAVKENLLQNIKIRNGAFYDGYQVWFQAKEVKLNCLMQATALQEFWRNHNALLFDLVRPGARTLHIDSTGHDYPCFYKNCSVSEFKPTGKIWLNFSITLLFI